MRGEGVVGVVEGRGRLCGTEGGRRRERRRSRNEKQSTDNRSGAKKQ
jgi:hypothetical protein